MQSPRSVQLIPERDPVKATVEWGVQQCVVLSIQLPGWQKPHIKLGYLDEWMHCIFFRPFSINILFLKTVFNRD